MAEHREHGISYLRVCAMWMIVLCHLTGASAVAGIYMLTMILNVGVEIFILISGYLSGLKKIESSGNWYRKRVLRIFPAYELCLLTMGILHAVRRIPFMGIQSWLSHIFCLQGIFGRAEAASHLWFLTWLLVCYGLTPVLSKLRENSQWYFAVFAAFVVLQIMFTFLVGQDWGRYLMLVVLYIVAYWMGVRKCRGTSKKQLIMAVCAVAFAMIGRLLGRHWLDGTAAYNIFIAGISQIIIAISGFYGFTYLFHKKPGKLVAFLESISYECYLMHYMFIVGPVSLMELTPWYAINCIAVMVASILAAWLLKLAAQQVVRLYYAMSKGKYHKNNAYEQK